MVNKVLGTKAKPREKMFVGHINNTYIFYLCIISDNTLSSVVPILGRWKLLEINLKHVHLIIQNMKPIVPNKSLSYNNYWIKWTARIIFIFAFHLSFPLRLFILCSPLLEKQGLKSENWHYLLVAKMFTSGGIWEVARRRRCKRYFYVAWNLYYVLVRKLLCYQYYNMYRHPSLYAISLYAFSL